MTEWLKGQAIRGDTHIKVLCLKLKASTMDEPELCGVKKTKKGEMLDLKCLTEKFKELLEENANIKRLIQGLYNENRELKLKVAQLISADEYISVNAQFSNNESDEEEEEMVC